MKETSYKMLQYYFFRNKINELMCKTSNLKSVKLIKYIKRTRYTVMKILKLYFLKILSVSQLFMFPSCRRFCSVSVIKMNTLEQRETRTLETVESSTR